MQPPQDEPSAGWRAGARDGLPFATAGAVLAVSFAVVARDLGVPRLAALAMSVVVFGGSAQFASVGILAAGGGPVAAVSAGALVMSRFLPMGVAVAGSLHGGRWRRALEGQAVVDSSWAMAARGGGRFDRTYLFGHTGIQYLGWVGGTALGVVGPRFDADALGLDAVFPSFFLALLLAEVRTRQQAAVAVAAAVVALALVPVAPVGAPVLVASAAALAGLRRRR